jgi:elongation factor P
LIIRWNGQLHRVTEFHHHAPGNWRAMVILKLKNIQSGKTIEERVRAGEDIDIVRVDKHNMQFLYREGDSYAFMDNESFEQIELTADVIGEGAEFLKDGAECEILYYDENRILGVEIPIFAELRVTESSMALRGDTATNVNKNLPLATACAADAAALCADADPTDAGGELACLLAAFTYGFAGIYGRRFKGLPPIKVATGQITASTAFLIPVTALAEHPWTLPMPDVHIWAALLGIALEGFGAGQVQLQIGG